MNSHYGSVDFYNGAARVSTGPENKINGFGSKGLGLFSATLFIAGEMAGSGLLALPKAIVNTGYIGIVLLVLFSINAAYGGVKLGNCWNIVEQRYPQHRSETRNPYAIIALKSVGRYGSIAVSHCIRFTLFGSGTVYLLLVSQIIQSLLDTMTVTSITSCTYFLIVACCIIPPMWLGSPKEFSFVGLGAILSTIVACILYFVQIVIDGKSNDSPVRHHIHGFHDFCLSFGTLMFAFGGASTFPTIQNDMKNKKEFSSSVILAFVNFNWKRCTIRTVIGLMIIMVGETIPQFGAILSLVGGSTITLATFVFPPYFYMKLCDKLNPQWEHIHIPLHERIYMWQLIGIGVAGGCASTFSAVSAILDSVTFSKPCYWIRC
ncbi:hypothetical protein NQ318_006998 [Aromia moschata]|uniref:Amino acid transporter transmembrane domain-containing protein n=1 Tax=Aromia moschata TaxID=1265417 RepID=A0AAV8XGJ4_9CUCU|nr:hypothetical protein NQ318_006998 [Aromia moschata]